MTIQVIKATFRFGPWHGQAKDLETAPMELDVPDGDGSVRYVVGHIDREDVHHYYLPAGLTAQLDAEAASKKRRR